ncbi:hypothetical protein KY329_01925, partial [Candidatus Woesearchaeota archaeon]|nr:hypothetical protein [Candidatus Woesearchaeota archaeon]
IGLSMREIEVYLFLAKNGASPTGLVAKRLKIERVQAYRIFKKMQEEFLITETLEKPARFMAVPFEELLEAYIDAKQTEVQNLVDRKEALIASWKTSRGPAPEQVIAKFSVINGKRRIYAKMLNMVQESKREILVLTTGKGFVQEDIAGVFDEILHVSQKQNLKSNIITDILRENLQVAKRLYKKIAPRNAEVEFRHVALASQRFPCFLIKDEEEAILHGSFSSESSLLNLEENGLWIFDKMFVSILKGFFIQLWQKAVGFKKYIDALETGIPFGETLVIRDPADAWVKIGEVLGAAKENVTAITPSDGIDRILKNDPFANYRKKNLSIHIMSSIDLDNIESAKKLATNYQIKHVPINYLSMLLVDKKALFIFRSPPTKCNDEERAFYSNDTFYTDDFHTADRASDMLNDIWKRGMQISELESQTGIRLPAVEVSSVGKTSELVDSLLQSNADAALIVEDCKPIGIVSIRDILKEFAKPRIDMRSTSIRDLDYTPLVEMENMESLLNTMKNVGKEGLNRIAFVKNGRLVGMLTEELGK